jgi:IS5 family transposase
MTDQLRVGRKVTPREAFLAEMDRLIPWPRLLALVTPYYPGTGAALHFGPERMLRAHLLGQWFNLSDAELEDGLYDSESLRRFAGWLRAGEGIPDAGALRGFRHALQQHGLTAAIFGQIQRVLDERGLLIKAGTIVNPTVVPLSAGGGDVPRYRGGERRRWNRRAPRGFDPVPAPRREVVITSR